MNKILVKSIITMLSCVMVVGLQGCGSKDEASEAEVNSKIAWSFKVQGTISSSPVSYENDIIFGSNNKNLYSVDSTTHEEKWTFASDSSIDTTPIVDGDSIIFTNQTSCYAVDAKSGQELWKYASGASETKKVDQWDIHAPSPILYKDLVIFPSQSGTIYAINKGDGSLAWEYAAPGVSEIRSTPSIQENKMSFGDIKGNCYVIDLDTQSTIMQKSLGTNIVTSSLIYKDYVYFAGRDTKIVAYNLNDGSEKWSHTDSMGSWYTADIIAKDDVIYVGGSDNLKLQAFNYESGDNVVNYLSKSNIFSKPVIVDNIVYLTSGNAYSRKSGNVLAFDINDSSNKVLECTFKEAIFSSPLVLNDIVYFGCLDGNLYAVNPKAE
ncbi:MAG: PQQ-binding-like beta-propeller repeat protein [Clostridium sp.]